MKAPAAGPGSRPLHLLFAVLLLATLWFTTRSWDASLLDRHEFRQLQTALSTYWLRETGWKLAYETPLFGPPWSIPLEFPVYQTIVAKISAWTGLRLEPTGRGVSLLFFFLTLPAVHGLAGMCSRSPNARLLAVAVVMTMPTYWFYARSFMIETTALCFSVWFLFATLRTADGAGWRWALLATLTGTLAGLAKVTTLLVHLGPAALGVLWLWWRRPPGSPAWLTRAALTGLPVAVALAAASAWVAQADEVKRGNPFAAEFTSAKLSSWNWGTWAQRFDPVYWGEFWSNVSQFVVGESALVVMLLAAVAAGAAVRRVAIVLVGCFLAATLTFWRLYYHHDYYYSANAVMLGLAAGLVLGGAWDNERLPRTLRLALVAAFFGGQFLVFHRGYGEYHRQQRPPTPGIAPLLRDTTPADGVILIYGWDWNSKLPYYAERRAVMVPVGREDDQAALETILARLAPRRVIALVVATEPLRTSPGFIRQRTDRLDLAAVPIATSEDGDVYLANALLGAAATALAGKNYAGVTLNLPAPEPEFAAQTPVDAAALALPVFTPAPRAARTLFGMSAGEIGGRPVLSAHAPAELEFAAPENARSIRAAFGLADEAWNGAAPLTDGIGVEIFERLPDGQRRMLHRRELDPVHRVTDRGLQRVDLPACGPFAGPLIFRFTTGPQGQAAKDWAYWSEIVLY